MSFLTVDARTNEYFLRYYANQPTCRKTRVPPNAVLNYIEYCWVLSYEQCLLTLMQDGYSMCVIDPIIRSVHARMDAEYSAFVSGHVLDV